MKILGALSTFALAAAAAAQTPLPLTNAGFENANLFNPSEPEGWHNLSGPNHALHRTVGDGMGFMPTPHGGNRCIEIRTPGASEFRGFTTDTVNFFLPGFPFYDPEWAWEGAAAGDLVLTGWYYIPSSAPVTGDKIGIKLNVKRANQDYATMDPWGGEWSTIEGDTGDQWRQFEVRWTLAEIQEEVIFNDTFGCGGNGSPCAGCFSPCLGPDGYPNHLKITIARFGFGNAPSTGTIFWDDLVYSIVPPTQGCPADFNGDGFLDFFDYDDYVNCFETANCPEGRTADFNGDDFVDFFDYDDYVAAFESGC